MTLILRSTRLSRDPDRNDWNIHEDGKRHADRLSVPQGSPYRNEFSEVMLRCVFGFVSVISVESGKIDNHQRRQDEYRDHQAHLQIIGSSR
jgi:hypothetical protein